MNEEKQIRCVAAELRAKPESRTVEGYAIRFGVESQDLGGFREIIQPRALDATLADGHNIFALAYHDRNTVLGRTSSGTLRLFPDTQGLRFELDLATHARAEEVYQNIVRQDVVDMSFGFYIDRETHYEDKVRGIWISQVEELRLVEISVVPEGAYTQPFVKKRSLELAKSQEAAKALWLQRNLELLENLRKT